MINTNNISYILILILVALLFLLICYLKKRSAVFLDTSKLKIYFLIEKIISGESINIEDLCNTDKKNIGIFYLLKNLAGDYLEKAKEFAVITYILYAFPLILLLIIPMYLLRFENFDIVFSSIVLFIALGWIFYYLYPITKTFYNKEKYIWAVADRLQQLSLDDKQIDFIIDQVKTDFDLYKARTPFVAFFSIIFTMALIFYEQVTEILQIPFVAVLIILLMMIGKQLHDKYKLKVIYIALQSLYVLKGEKLSHIKGTD